MKISESHVGPIDHYSRTVDFNLVPVEVGYDDDDEAQAWPQSFDTPWIDYQGTPSDQLPEEGEFIYNLYDPNPPGFDSDPSQPVGSIFFTNTGEAIRVYQIHVLEEYRDTNAFWELVKPAIQMARDENLWIDASFENEDLERVFIKAMQRGKIPVNPEFEPRHVTPSDWQKDIRPGIEILNHITASVHDALVESVRANLTPDLLKPQFREAPFPTGHCYVAAEAIYHLAGGRDSGLVPVRLKMPDGVVHWWLQDRESGEVIDPTHDQFHGPVAYEHGKPGGFLTREPSKRAQEVMRRVKGIEVESMIYTAASSDSLQLEGPIALDDWYFNWMGGRFQFGDWQQDMGAVVYNVRDADPDDKDFENPLVGSISFREERNQVSVEEIYVEPEYRTTSAFMKLLQPVLATGKPINASFENAKLQQVFMKLVQRGTIPVADDFEYTYPERMLNQPQREMDDQYMLSGYEQQREATFKWSTKVIHTPPLEEHGIAPHRRTFIYLPVPDVIFLAPNNAYHSKIYDFIYDNYPDWYETSRYEEELSLGLIERDWNDRALTLQWYEHRGQPMPESGLVELEREFGEPIYTEEFDVPLPQVDFMGRDIDYGDQPDWWEGEDTEQWPQYADDNPLYHDERLTAFDTTLENPVNYQYVPLTEFELSAYDTLQPDAKRRWEGKARRFNSWGGRYSPSRVNGRTLYALQTRYQGRCAYCGLPGATSFDHVVPLSRGGQHEPGNLLPCHRECNGYMNDWDMKLEPKPGIPFKDHWREHPAEAKVAAPERLYHATPLSNVDKIMREGLIPQASDHTKQYWPNAQPYIHAHHDVDQIIDIYSDFLHEKTNEPFAVLSVPAKYFEHYLNEEGYGDGSGLEHDTWYSKYPIPPSEIKHTGIEWPDNWRDNWVFDTKDPTGRHSMADRTGHPEVDALIEEFLQTPQGEWTTDVEPIEALRNPELAHGMCQAVTQQFVEFAKAKGFKAYVTDTDLDEMGYEPTGEGGEIGFDENDEMQYGFYPEHTIATIVLPGTGYGREIYIDFTATQYGYTDHPKVSAATPRVLRVKTPQRVKGMHGVYGMPFTYIPWMNLILLADTKTYHTAMWQRMPQEFQQQVFERRNEMVMGHIVPVKGNYLGGIQYYLEAGQIVDEETQDTVANALKPYVEALEFEPEEEEYVEPTKPSGGEQLSLIGQVKWSVDYTWLMNQVEYAAQEICAKHNWPLNITWEGEPDPFGGRNSAWVWAKPKDENQEGTWMHSDIQEIEMKMPPIIDKFTYYVALHELAHLNFVDQYGRDYNSHEEELWAMHWAIEHGAGVVDRETMEFAAKFVNTYYDPVQLFNDDLKRQAPALPYEYLQNKRFKALPVEQYVSKMAEWLPEDDPSEVFGEGEQIPDWFAKLRRTLHMYVSGDAVYMRMPVLYTKDKATWQVGMPFEHHYETWSHSEMLQEIPFDDYEQGEINAELRNDGTVNIRPWVPDEFKQAAELSALDIVQQNVEFWLDEKDVPQLRFAAEDPFTKYLKAKGWTDEVLDMYNNETPISPSILEALKADIAEYYHMISSKTAGTTMYRVTPSKYRLQISHNGLEPQYDSGGMKVFDPEYIDQYREPTDPFAYPFSLDPDHEDYDPDATLENQGMEKVYMFHDLPSAQEFARSYRSYQESDIWQINLPTDMKIWHDPRDYTLLNIDDAEDNHNFDMDSQQWKPTPFFATETIPPEYIRLVDTVEGADSMQWSSKTAAIQNVNYQPDAYSDSVWKPGYLYLDSGNIYMGRMGTDHYLLADFIDTSQETNRYVKINNYPGHAIYVLNDEMADTDEHMGEIEDVMPWIDELRKLDPGVPVIWVGAQQHTIGKASAAEVLIDTMAAYQQDGPVILDSNGKVWFGRGYSSHEQLQIEMDKLDGGHEVARAEVMDNDYVPQPGLLGVAETAQDDLMFNELIDAGVPLRRRLRNNSLTELRDAPLLSRTAAWPKFKEGETVLVFGYAPATVVRLVEAPDDNPRGPEFEGWYYEVEGSDGQTYTLEEGHLHRMPDTLPEAWGGSLTSIGITHPSHTHDSPARYSAHTLATPSTSVPQHIAPLTLGREYASKHAVTQPRRDVKADWIQVDCAHCEFKDFEHDEDCVGLLTVRGDTHQTIGADPHQGATPGYPLGRTGTPVYATDSTFDLQDRWWTQALESLSGNEPLSLDWTHLAAPSNIEVYQMPEGELSYYDEDVIGYAARDTETGKDVGQIRFIPRAFNKSLFVNAIWVLEDYRSKGVFQELVKVILPYKQQGYEIQAQYANERLKALMERRLSLTASAADLVVLETNLWDDIPGARAKTLRLHDRATQTDVGRVTFGISNDNKITVSTIQVDKEYRNTPGFMMLVEPIVQMLDQGYELDTYFVNPRLKEVIEKWMGRKTLSGDYSDPIRATGAGEIPTKIIPAEGQDMGYDSTGTETMPSKNFPYVNAYTPDGRDVIGTLMFRDGDEYVKSDDPYANPAWIDRYAGKVLVDEVYVADEYQTTGTLFAMWQRVKEVAGDRPIVLGTFFSNDRLEKIWNRRFLSSWHTVSAHIEVKKRPEGDPWFEWDGTYWPGDQSWQAQWEGHQGEDPGWAALYNVYVNGEVAGTSYVLKDGTFDSIYVLPEYRNTSAFADLALYTVQHSKEITDNFQNDRLRNVVERWQERQMLSAVDFETPNRDYLRWSLFEDGEMISGKFKSHLDLRAKYDKINKKEAARGEYYPSQQIAVGGVFLEGLTPEAVLSFLRMHIGDVASFEWARLKGDRMVRGTVAKVGASISVESIPYEDLESYGSEYMPSIPFWYLPRQRKIYTTEAGFTHSTIFAWLGRNRRDELNYTDELRRGWWNGEVGYHFEDNWTDEEMAEVGPVVQQWFAANPSPRLRPEMLLSNYMRDWNYIPKDDYIKNLVLDSRWAGFPVVVTTSDELIIGDPETKHPELIWANGLQRADVKTLALVWPDGNWTITEGEMFDEELLDEIPEDVFEWGVDDS